MSDQSIKIPDNFLKKFDIKQATLKIVTDPNKILEYQYHMISIFEKSSTKNGIIRIGLPMSDVLPGTTTNYEDFKAFWIKSQNIWWSFKKLDTAKYPRFRNLFGILEPHWLENDKRHRNHQVCEINPSLTGEMRTNGAFLTSGNQVFFSAWRIGGERGRGRHINEIEDIFSEKSKLYTIKSKDKQKKYFLLVDLNSPEFLEQITFFIKNLNHLKKQFEQMDLEMENNKYKRKFPIDTFASENTESLVHVRKKQDKFKNALLQEYDDRCVFCGLDIVEYLTGAHIVPYSIMCKEDPQNAMNPSDGILLCRLCDIAFEKGDICLQENYEITINHQLKESKNPAISVWLSNINKKIPIRTKAKFVPDVKYIRRKLELVK